MPFTPFHMGPALPVKAACGHRFSLLLYGYTQILMDVEALYRIVNQDRELHGLSHTFLGATGIAAVALITGKPLMEFWLRFWHRIERRSRRPGFLMSEKIPWRVSLFSVLTGSWLHIILDAIMHRDVHPFKPFSDSNPFLRIISVEQLHQFCLFTAIGGSVWIGVACLFRVQRVE